MSSETHVFVCYNTLSYEAALRIIDGLSGGGAEPRCAVLLLCDADLERLPASVARWTMTPPMHALSRFEKPFRIASWFARVHAELLARFPGSFHAYVPHPLELPGNHFVFSKRPGDTVDLLPDGLVNYFERTMRPERLSAVPRYCVRIALEKIAARRHGFRYRPVWRGHQTQYEGGHYRTSWAFNPQGYLTVSGKLEVLPPVAGARDAAQRPSQRAVLFLDQELHQIVGPELEAEMRRRALELIREQAPEVLYYKAHPRGKNRCDELGLGDVPIRDCSGPGPAERLVALEGIRTVVGFYSTSLLLLSAADVDVRFAVFPDPEDPRVRRPALVREARKPIQASGAVVVVAGGRGAQ